MRFLGAARAPSAVGKARRRRRLRDRFAPGAESAPRRTPRAAAPQRPGARAGTAATRLRRRVDAPALAPRRALRCALAPPARSRARRRALRGGGRPRAGAYAAARDSSMFARPEARRRRRLAARPRAGARRARARARGQPRARLGRGRDASPPGSQMSSRCASPPLPAHAARRRTRRATGARSIRRGAAGFVVSARGRVMAADEPSARGAPCRGSGCREATPITIGETLHRDDGCSPRPRRRAIAQAASRAACASSARARGAAPC